jgi:hypothetical protein
MATLRISIEMENAAFEKGHEWLEVNRILRRIMDYNLNGNITYTGTLVDINGNTVGLVTVE